MLDSIVNELNNLEYKVISEGEVAGNDLFSTFSSVETNIKTINKNSKKSIMSIELLKEDVEKKNNEIFKLQNEVKERQLNEVKVYRKILLIIDQVDNIWNYAKQSENQSLLDSIDMIKKIITREIGHINLTEIKSIGEFFNPQLHKCVGTIENDNNLPNEIVSVVEAGYILKGEVIRPTSVVIAK